MDVAVGTDIWVAVGSTGMGDAVAVGVGGNRVEVGDAETGVGEKGKGVYVGILVGVLIAVLVAVAVGVLVRVGVGVLVTVEVGVRVEVGVGVLVEVGEGDGETGGGVVPSKLISPRVIDQGSFITMDGFGFSIHE